MTETKNMTNLWNRRHMPRYVTEPFYVPGQNERNPCISPAIPDGTVLPPVDLEPGKQYPVMIWCVGGVTGAYESLVARLPEQGIGTAFFRFSANSETPGFPEVPLEREREAFAALMERIERLNAEQSWIDAERISVGGTGFGALTAAYALGETGKFRRGVLGPAVYDAATAYGTGIAGSMPPVGESLLSFYETGARHSILTRIDRIKTPILFLYDHGDTTVGISQVEEFYSAMKDRNPDVPCRMAVSPENGPDMTALSDDFLNEIKRWLEEDVHGD